MTVKEIAKLAGVSPSAISVVLNDRKGVSDETRKRVLDIIKKYNYTNNKKSKFTAKNICFIKYKKHGLLVEQNQGFITGILDSIESESRLEGYNLSMVNSVGNLADTIKEINLSMYDGIIVLGTELDEDQYQYLNQIRQPCIVLDNPVRCNSCNSVSINNYDTVHCALSHLAALNHKSIAYFHSNVDIANFEERHQAFLKCCEEFRFDFKSEYQFDLTPTLVGSYEEMKRKLESCQVLPDCAFADNDSIAIGAIKALRESGYKVPDDISVIGFDDIDFSKISTPSLSTMKIPKTLIGTLAVRQICSMIEHYKYSDVKLLVGGELVVRSSTAPLADR